MIDLTERYELIKAILKDWKEQPNKPNESNHPPLGKIAESEESLNGVLINYQVIVRLSVKMVIIIWLDKELVGCMR